MNGQGEFNYPSQPKPKYAQDAQGKMNRSINARRAKHEREIRRSLERKAKERQERESWWTVPSGSD